MRRFILRAIGRGLMSVFIGLTCVSPSFATVFWVVNGTTNALSTNYMPAGFCKATVSLATGDVNRVFLDNNIDAQSWSGGITFDFKNNRITNIPRNDQGNNLSGIALPEANPRISTLISTTNPSAVGQRFGLLTPAGTASWIASVSNLLTGGYAWPLSNTKVFIGLNQDVLGVEEVILRYSTNDWVSATELLATDSGNHSDFYAFIPGMINGTLVRYYALTTVTKALSNITNGPDSDVNYLTLSCLGDTENSFSYSVAVTLHTILIDGANDFLPGAQEAFPATTAGYTNWVTWDTNKLYIGAYGADIGTGDPDIALVMYFSTNSNAAEGSGCAYGNAYHNQAPVLPFKAEFLFNYYMNGTWDSARWNGSTWDWSADPLNGGTTLSTSGNYLEIAFNRTNFASSRFLKAYIQMVDSNYFFPWTYAAIPFDTLADGNDSNPSNYISFGGVFGYTNITPSSNLYLTNDTTAPASNALLFPPNNFSNYAYSSLVLSNYATDEIGIYQVRLYEVPNTLLYSFEITNSNALQALTLPAGALALGSRQLYTVAVDTRNQSLSSATNTLVVHLDSEVHWVQNGADYQMKAEHMPRGYCKATAVVNNAQSFRVFYGANVNATSWSANYTVSWSAGSLTNIMRNDQGNNSDGVAQPLSTGKLHTLISVTNPGMINQRFGLLYPDGIPSWIVSCSNAVGTNAWSLSNTRVFITLNTTNLPNEVVLCRYTTNDWATAAEVAATGADSNFSAVIPAMPAGTVVSYYVMTTTTAASNQVITGPDSNVNFMALSCLDNNGSNYGFYVHGTPHTVAIDGVNDFCTDKSETFLATTAGYTNWLTWDTGKFYIGYTGADIGTADPNKALVIYFGTNSNTAAGPGTAYGAVYNNQQAVLPFRAEYVLNYFMDGTWDSAVWDVSNWVWSSPLNSGVTLSRSGDYLEFSIDKTAFASTKFLKTYLQMVDQAAAWNYGAIPQNTFSDAANANPSNFVSFYGKLWGSNALPSSNVYVTNDPVAPDSNALLYPSNNYTNWADEPLEIQNYCSDDIGIYKIAVYSTPATLLATWFLGDSNTLQSFNLDPWTFQYGTYQIYTVAWDTKNQSKSSATNTLIVRTNSSVNDSKVHWIQNGVNYVLKTNNMPTGFCKTTVSVGNSNRFRIYYETNSDAQSWSGQYTIIFPSFITNIPRNDQGNNQLGYTVPEKDPKISTLISSTTPSGASQRFGLLTPAGTPSYIVSVSNLLNGGPAWSLSNTKVFINTDKAKLGGEGVMLRYSTNNWVSATEILAIDTGNKSNFYAFIPAMPAGVTVGYYPFTTGFKAIAALTNGADADVDYLTLSCLGDSQNPYNYYVQGTPHTVAIDGVNDFCTNDSEAFPTTTAGYTNWVTWDTTNLYLGYYGADISANDPNKLLVMYFSTNSNGYANNGTPYGVWYSNQMPVLPFRANFALSYDSTGAWDSAKWTGTQWDWSANPLNGGLRLATGANFLELAIMKTNFGSSTRLNYYAQMVDRSKTSEKTYGAVPSGTLVDGYLANPSNFLSFSNRMWISNIIPASNIYKTNDNLAPTSNTILFPAHNATNYTTNTLILSNFCREETGVYRILVYTNTNALLKSVLVTNTNELYPITIPSYTFMKYGTNVICTAAYDTRNTLISRNTNILFIITNGIEFSIDKTIDRVVYGDTNFLLPGAIVYYKITYGNGSPGAVANMIINDFLPQGTTYYTNYAGTGDGWTVQFSPYLNPDQSYASPDYDTSTNSVQWVRFIKASVPAYETNKTLYIGVTVN